MLGSRALLLAASLLLGVGSATAQWADWDYDLDQEKKPWSELQVQIPPYPQPQNLVRVPAGSRASHAFYIDANSVTVGEDGVTRYSAVLKTTGGATNVTFEGMRCKTRERRIYAVGHNDGTWARARDNKWMRIEHSDIAPHRYVLYREYFCSEHTRPTPAKQALDALRRGAALGRSGTLDD
jgi:hypothetical protein